MQAQIYLITPADADASFAAQLEAALEGNQVAALLIQRGALDESAYKALAKALVPVAQNAGCAALLDNMPDAVLPLGADGVHITGDIKAVKQAVKMLKPHAIVGTGGIRSRHDAMTKGEQDVDYVFFGTLGQQNDDEVFENTQWWAETFNVPAVCFCEPADTLEQPFEFIALREQVWNSDNPNTILREFLRSE